MSARRAAENPLAGAANLRGGILIAVAVVVGVVLLGKGFDAGIIGSSGGDPSDEVATGNDDGGDGGDAATEGEGVTTTTAAVAHTPAEVRVQVLNSAGPSGSAGNASTRLSTAGFVALGATNADDRAATASAIYVQPGYEADGVAVATTLGLTTTTPQPMPAPPPPPAPVEANVVVVLGPDYVIVG